MYAQLKALQSEGNSQRTIARKLNINRRTVAKLIKMDEKEAVAYCNNNNNIQYRSGFDIAKDFIIIKLAANPGTKKRALYHQVIKHFPDIKLTERAFGNYIDKIKSNRSSSRRQYNRISSHSSGETIKKNHEAGCQKEALISYKDIKISSKIRMYRKLVGLTCRELADKISVSPPMITYYEKGEKRPSIKTIVKIAAATQIPVECFLTDKEYCLDYGSNAETKKKAAKPVKEESENKVVERKDIGKRKNELNQSYSSLSREGRQLHKNKGHHNLQTPLEIEKQVKSLLEQASKIMTSDPGQAIELGEKALKMAGHNNYELGVGLAHKKISEVYFHGGDYYNSLKNLLKAEQPYKKHQYYEGLREIYNNIGVVYHQWNDLENALKYHKKNLELDKYVSNPSFTSAALNNIGSIYSLLNDRYKALEYCKKALDVCIKHNRLFGRSNVLNNMGKIHYSLKLFDKAEHYYYESITANEAIGNLLGLTQTYINLSELKGDTGLIYEALNLLEKALGYAKKLNDNFRFAKIYLLLSNIYAKMNNKDEQLKYLEKCVAIAEPHNYRSIALSAYTILAEINEIRGNLSAALDCFKKVQKLKDYLNNEKRTRSIEEIKTKMEVEQTEREKALLQQKNTELQQMNEKILQQNEKLEIADRKITEYNRNLEIKVQDEIRKRRKQEHLIIQKTKLESLGKMAAGIAHEINQPLGLIQLSFQNLFNKLENNKLTPEYLANKSELIFTNIGRIKKIIDHIRTFSRGQKEKTEIFKVDQTLENSLLLINTQYDNHNINIVKKIQVNCANVRVNQYRLEQVFLNILANAKDALDSKFDENDDSKTIRIRVYNEQSKIKIEFEDNGCGVGEEQLQHVFEPFYTTKDEKKGTGLGMSISYGIVNEMGGKITMKSKKGSFTVVIVELPVVR